MKDKTVINWEGIKRFRNKVDNTDKLTKQIVLINELTDEQLGNLINQYPLWEVGKSYVIGERVRYNNKLYEVRLSHSSQEDWSPERASNLFLEVFPDETEGGAEIIADWIQPPSDKPYMIGDKVRFEGKIYESVIDKNVWSPTGHPPGWKEIKI